MPRPVMLLAALALSLAAGCSSTCLDVQVILCSCSGKTQDERNTCKTNAQAQEKLAPPTDAELEACTTIAETCQAHIDQFGCDSLQTPEGRKACGQSRQ